MAEGQPMRRRGGQETKVAGKVSVKAGKPEMDAIAETDFTTGSAADSTEDRPFLPEDSRVRIGQHLRAIYNQIVEQPVPESLLKLLRELEQQEGKKKDDGR